MCSYTQRTREDICIYADCTVCSRPQEGYCFRGVPLKPGGPTKEKGTSMWMTVSAAHFLPYAFTTSAVFRSSGIWLLSSLLNPVVYIRCPSVDVILAHAGILLQRRRLFSQDSQCGHQEEVFSSAINCLKVRYSRQLAAAKGSH